MATWGGESSGRLTLVLGLLLALAALRSWALAATTSGIDFYQFWAVGRALAQGHAGDVYADAGRARIGDEQSRAAAASGSPRQQAAAARRGRLETYSTPFLYAVLRPLARLSYDAAWRAFHVLSLAAGLAGILALAWAAGHPPACALALALLLCEWFEPWLSDVRVANVGRLQVALLGAVVVLDRRGRVGAAAAVAVAAALFKPNLAAASALLLWVWLRGAHRREALAGAAAGAVAAVAATFAAFGTLTCWLDWARALASLPPEIVTTEMGNFAPLRLLGVPAIAGTAAAVALLAAAAWLLRDGPAGAAVAVGALLGLLTAPLVWVHYHLLVIPALLLATAPGRSQAIAGAALAAATVLALNPLRAIVEPPPAIAASASAAAVVVLLGTTLCGRRGNQRLGRG